jgi:hypothetical protein
MLSSTKNAQCTTMREPPSAFRASSRLIFELNKKRSAEARFGRLRGDFPFGWLHLKAATAQATRTDLAARDAHEPLAGVVNPDGD